MLQLLWLIPAIPFASALVLALFGRRMSQRMVAIAGAGSVGLSALISLAIVPAFLASGTPFTQVLVDLDRCGGIPPRNCVLSRSGIAAHGGGRDLRELSHPSVLRRIHGGGRGLRPVLRVHESVCRLHGGSGAGRQSFAALSRMGRRRLMQLPAHRLLVQGSRKRAGCAQSIHRHARWRHRHDRRTLYPVSHASERFRSRTSCIWQPCSGRLARRMPRLLRLSCLAAPLASLLNCRCRPGCPTPWLVRLQPVH